jgi:uncharacterized protein
MIDDDPADLPALIPAAHDRKMLEALVCPLTQGPLHYDAARSELVSKSAHLAFPIRDGIPIMLLAEARALD